MPVSQCYQQRRHSVRRTGCTFSATLHCATCRAADPRHLMILQYFLDSTTKPLTSLPSQPTNTSAFHLLFLPQLFLHTALASSFRLARTLLVIHVFGIRLPCHFSPLHLLTEVYLVLHLTVLFLQHVRDALLASSLICMCTQLCSLLRFFIPHHVECLFVSGISHAIRGDMRFVLVSLIAPDSVSTASQKQVTCVSMDLVPSVQCSLRLLSPGSSPKVSAWIHNSRLARAPSAPPQLA